MGRGLGWNKSLLRKVPGERKEVRKTRVKGLLAISKRRERAWKPLMGGVERPA